MNHELDPIFTKIFETHLGIKPIAHYARGFIDGYKTKEKQDDNDIQNMLTQMANDHEKREGYYGEPEASH